MKPRYNLCYEIIANYHLLCLLLWYLVFWLFKTIMYNAIRMFVVDLIYYMLYYMNMIWFKKLWCISCDSNSYQFLQLDFMINKRFFKSMNTLNRTIFYPCLNTNHSFYQVKLTCSHDWVLRSCKNSCSLNFFHISDFNNIFISFLCHKLDYGHCFQGVLPHI